MMRVAVEVPFGGQTAPVDAADILLRSANLVAWFADHRLEHARASAPRGEPREALRSALSSHHLGTVRGR